MFDKSKLGAPQGLVPKGSVLRGDFVFAHGLRVEGVVEGDVRASAEHPGMLVIAEGGSVLGSVEAPVVVVHGRVSGPVLASERLELHSGAEVDGEMQYRHLDMGPGVKLMGQLRPILGLDEETRLQLMAKQTAEDATE